MHRGIKKLVAACFSRALGVVFKPAVEAPSRLRGVRTFRQRSNWSGIAGLAALCVGFAVEPALSQTDGENEGRQIRFRYITFDPLESNPNELTSSRLHKTTQSDGSDAAAENCYLVQFTTQAQESYQNEVKRLGADIRTHVPDNTVVACMTGSEYEEVRQLPYVRWVGDFHAAYKLQPSLIEMVGSDFEPEGTSRYSILLHDSDSDTRAAVAERIDAIGGSVVMKPEGSRIVQAMLNSQQLIEIANMNEVLYIDAWQPYEDDVDDGREFTGANFIEAVAGYTGQGVRGEVLDDGVRTSHENFQGGIAPVEHIAFNYSGHLGPGGVVIDDDFNHGTNVYSIVFATGAGNPKARGMLPDATPIFSSRKHFDEPDTIGRDAHTAELVDPNGPYRAVFQTSSFGTGRTLEYTTVSAEIDDIVFKYDIVLTQSQSNEGDTPQPRSSRPEAWAKNNISVGGMNMFESLITDDDAWDETGSIGPAADGRLKPDVSHFYGNVYSADEGADDDYGDFGGTSGATPLVAGAVGLIHQMWADGVFAGTVGMNRDVFDSRPHAATAKALLIHSAAQYPFSGPDDERARRVYQGWGIPQVDALYESARRGNWQLPLLIDETLPLLPADTHRHTIDVPNSNKPLRITLVYKDPPGTPASVVDRINDLTLKVTSPSNVRYWGNYGLMETPWSAPGGRPDFINTVENVFVGSPEPGIWTVEVSGDTIVQDTHAETPEIDAVYALVATDGRGTAATDVHTYEARIQAGEDDVEEAADGTIIVDEEVLEIVDNGGDIQTIGLRFTNVAIPDNATIVSARLQFEANGTSRDDASFTIYGESTDDAAAFTAMDNDVSSRTTTAASVDWVPRPWIDSGDAGVDQRSPNMAGVVQEIIDRDGWAIGNDMVYILTGTGERSADAIEVGEGGEIFSSRSVLDAARLQVEYTDGTIPEPGSNTAPFVYAGEDQVVDVNDGASLAAIATDDGLPSRRLTTRWSVVSGPGNVVLGNENAARTTASFMENGTYVLRLTAEDGELTTDGDVSVVVSGIFSPPPPPPPPPPPLPPVPRSGGGSGSIGYMFLLMLTLTAANGARRRFASSRARY